MTPLAMKFMREIATPLARRRMQDARRVVDAIREPHCFEMTAAIPIMDAVQAAPSLVLEKTMFLPADETWIEWRTSEGGRRGYFLRSVSADEFEVFHFNNDGIEYVCAFSGMRRLRPDDAFSDDDLALTWCVLAVLLAIINTPRLVSRRDHSPHRGLARELQRTAGGRQVGLRVWSEIILEITPRLATGDATDEQRLSGKKCLHFCRSHLRVQNGRLVVVRPHWRGDASLGVAQSTYRVAA